MGGGVVGLFKWYVTPEYKPKSVPQTDFVITPGVQTSQLQVLHVMAKKTFKNQ
jgi:hypothetical protein